MPNRSLILGFAAFALAGCGDEAERSADQPSQIPSAVIDDADTIEENAVVRDVQFFLDNPGKRRAVREKCRNDPGALENTQDCVNADEANSEARRRSTRERLGG